MGDPTRPAAMFLGITRRTGGVLLLIRRLQVRVLPGAPEPQVSGRICRSPDDCWRTLVIPSVVHRTMIVPLELAVRLNRVHSC
jgi:hypothetical protein